MLADPELELLRELLVEDPGAWVFVDVARELARRGDHSTAIATLYAGIERHPRRADAWDALAEVCPGPAPLRKALAAFTATVGTDQLDEALAWSYRRLQERAQDIRYDAPTPVQPVRRPPRADDPMVSAPRAEAYAAMGRPDRAVRVYRRLVRQDPSNRGWAARLSALLALAASRSTDDLSGSLPAPELPSIPLLRPATARDGATAPDLGRRMVEPATPVGVPRRVTARLPTYGGFSDEDTTREITRGPR